MRTVLFLVFFVSLSGCQLVHEFSAETRKERAEARKADREEAHQEYVHQFDGKTEDEIILLRGAPTKSEQVGSFKVFTYFKDNGTTAYAKGSSGLVGGNNFGTQKAQYLNHFEQTRFYFKDGKCAKWDEEEQ